MATHMIRTFLLYTAAIIAVRLMGKRQIGELQPTDFVVTLMISDLASVPMQDMGIPLLSGIVPIAVLLCIEIFLSVFELKSPAVAKLLAGRSVPVVKNGKIDQKSLKQLRVTGDDLLEELRLKDVFDLNRVVFAQMETNGKLSVLVSKSQPTVPEGYASIIISDGKLSKDGLCYSGKDRKWVDRTLSANNISSIKDVFLLTVDEYENIILLPEDRTR